MKALGSVLGPEQHLPPLSLHIPTPLSSLDRAGRPSAARRGQEPAATLFLADLSIISCWDPMERICVLACFCLHGSKHTWKWPQVSVLSSGTSCILRWPKAACSAPMSLFQGPGWVSATQIPLLAFCFTHYHEFFLSSGVQENIISIFRRNNSALHPRPCQALIFIIGAHSLLYHILVRLFKTLHVCILNWGGWISGLRG